MRDSASGNGCVTPTPPNLLYPLPRVPTHNPSWPAHGQDGGGRTSNRRTISWMPETAKTVGAQTATSWAPVATKTRICHPVCISRVAMLAAPSKQMEHNRGE